MGEGESSEDANFVTNMRSAREARGWSQAQLADALSRSGVETSQSAVSRIENGDREPKSSELRAIAKVFGTTVDAMFRVPEAFEEHLEWNRVSSEFYEARQALIGAGSRYESARRALSQYLDSPDRKVRLAVGLDVSLRAMTAEDPVQILGPMLPKDDYNPLGYFVDPYGDAGDGLGETVRLIDQPPF